jgi:probable F420-dependent oxidoreductase
MAFEIGLHLNNAHPLATTENVVELGQAAEREGFAAIWMTEHIVVESDMLERYGTVAHPYTALAYLAGRTERVRLGTSVIVAPLHDPFLLAKLAAEIQALSGGRMRLGLGAGWYEPEFRYMKRPFDHLGRRLDEDIDLIKAIWAGETSFDGKYWQAEDMRMGPLPHTPPELWIGGKSEWAAARAERLGATWHPIELNAEDIARAKEKHPGLKIVPRVTEEEVDLLAEGVAAMREAGADGAAAGMKIGPPKLNEIVGEIAGALGLGG